MDVAIDSFFRSALPMGLVVGSLLIGLLLQRLVGRRLHKVAQEPGRGWGDVLVRALRGVVAVWAVLIGAAAAIRIAALPPAAFLVLEKALIVAAILSGTVFVARAASGLTELYLTKTAGIPSTIFRNLAVIVAGMVGVLVILDELGVPIAPIVTALGVGGLAFALALQESLSNLFAGLHILMSKNIRRGDYIKLTATDKTLFVEGTVTDITWRNTTLRALENNLVIIPNKKLAESILVNHDLPGREMLVYVDVRLPYGADLRRVEAILLDEAREALRAAGGGAASFEPKVRYAVLGDFNIKATLVLRSDDFVGQYPLRHETIKRIRDRFAREGIGDPVPAAFRDDPGGPTA